MEALQQENRYLRERLEDYERLHGVLEAISASVNVEAVLAHIVEGAIAIAGADQGAVVLLDPSDRSEARTLIRQAESDDVKLDHFLNMLLAGWVTTHGKPLLSDDLSGILGDAARDRYAAVRSALSIPLVRNGETIGNLNLIRLGNSAPFSGRELDLLTVLATTFAQFIHNARLHDHLFEETQRLRKEVQGKYAPHGIIGQSAELLQVFKLLERVIPTDVRLLIQGESGTGKELIARVTHYSGPRKNGPFVAVDCGALPANLLEGELFGYVKGAFTGAHKDKRGLFEVADKGTLFLDEISNMPLEVQSKFLRTLQEGEIRPLGATSVRKVDVRVIAAGSGTLKDHVAEGNFRQDLYYRLNVVTIHLPPLRSRRGDLPVLADHFLRKMAERHKKRIRGIRPDAMAVLESHSWPGNVRELENVVERMVILADDDQEMLGSDLLPMDIQPGSPLTGFAPMPAERGDIRQQKDNLEKMRLIEALSENGWNQSAAARHLGVSERTVRYKMRKFKIEKPGGE